MTPQRGAARGGGRRCRYFCYFPIQKYYWRHRLYYYKLLDKLFIKTKSKRVERGHTRQIIDKTFSYYKQET